MRLRISEVEISTQFDSVLQILLQHVVKMFLELLFTIFWRFLWFPSNFGMICKFDSGNTLDLGFLIEVAISDKLTSEMSISCKNHENNH